MRPTNTFCDYRTHINGDKLFAQTLMFVLRDAVCDLELTLNQGDGRPIQAKKVHTSNSLIGRSSIKLILTSERSPRSCEVKSCRVNERCETYHEKLWHGQIWRLFHGECVPPV